MIYQTTHDFHSIVMQNTPLIDVRAPIEFEKGAFPNAVNLPIMDNEERRLIGTTYKENGNEEAVKLGHFLVSGVNKEQKIANWVSFMESNPNAYLYCFRGGLRSKISQEWLSEALNRPVARLEGGYKAFRQYLIDATLPKNQNYKPIRLGGHTGSAKTVILKELEHSIDLEDLAKHRGSAFGTQLIAQPTQIDFENALAYDSIKKCAQNYKHIIFEDEGRHVGRCYLPQEFSLFVNSSPLVIVEVPFVERSHHILNEYVTQSQQEYVTLYGLEDGLNRWLTYILTSMDKAKKKLGGVKHMEMTTLAKEAFNSQQGLDHSEGHLSWIEYFLRDYYDPMYGYQLEQNKDLICYRGPRSEVIAYLQSLK